MLKNVATEPLGSAYMDWGFKSCLTSSHRHPLHRALQNKKIDFVECFGGLKSARSTCAEYRAAETADVEADGGGGKPTCSSVNSSAALQAGEMDEPSIGDLLENQILWRCDTYRGSNNSVKDDGKYSIDTDE